MGRPLSAALANYPKVFSPTWVEVIAVAERTGTIVPTLRELGQHAENTAKTLQQATGALWYPLTILVVSAVPAVILLGWLLPRFVGMLEETGGELPPITRFLLDVQSTVVHRWPYILAIGVALVIAATSYFRSEASRRYVQLTLMATPLAGLLLEAMAMERFAGLAARLLRGGVPLLDAVDVCTRIFQPLPVYRDAFCYVRERIASGRSLSMSMMETDLFPPLAASMIKIGEESAQLPETLEKLAEHFRERSKQQLTVVLKFVEPAAIFLVSIVIGVVVLAVYLPMLELQTRISQ